MTYTKSDLCYLTISEASKLIQTHQLSPVELTKAFLDRIETLDGKLHAYIKVTSELALRHARVAEKEILSGEYRGPFHGIPFALKDIYDTKDIQTTAGSRLYQDRIPKQDATTTARLKDAGGVLLGKLHTYEFALGGPDFSTPYQPARNPWNMDHITGGSSSGSAVSVAAGLAMGALGSCTGGSIRGPASLCGIVGLKPTYGRVSRAGVVTLSWSQDHCGPMTWTVEDTALMLQIIAGHDAKDPASSRAPVPNYVSALTGDIKGVVFGLPREYFFTPGSDVSPEVVSIVEKEITRLEKLGARAEEVNLPSLPYVRAANAVIMVSEAAAFHQDNLAKTPENYGEVTRARFRLGRMFSARDYIQAQRWRPVAVREFSEALRRVDFLVTPTMTQPAAKFEGYDPLFTAKDRSFTAPFNFTGLPAISVPAGFTDAGLPVGMQIVGKPFDEPGVLRAAHAYQQDAGWFKKRPELG